MNEIIVQSSVDKECNNVTYNNNSILSCITLNVGGLRSKLLFPSFTTFIQMHDIICINESKLSDADIVQINGFTTFYKNRRKYKRQSGGVLLLIRDRFLKYVTIFEEERFRDRIDNSVIDIYSFVKFKLCQNAIWFSLDKSLLDKAVLFAAVYIEPVSSNYFNRNVYAEMERTLINLDFNHVCLLGDFNSRTGELNETVSKCPHIEDYDELSEFDLIKRASKDKQTNQMGHELISFCKTCQLLIANGRLANDLRGNLTCKDASVIDYCILSYELFVNVHYFNVCEFNELFSDVHCAVNIQFEMVSHIDDTGDAIDEINTNKTRETSNEQSYFVKWDTNQAENFSVELIDDDICRLDERLDECLVCKEPISSEEIDKIVRDTTAIFKNAATRLGMIKKRKKRKDTKPFTKKIELWFDYQCNQKRKALTKARSRALKFRNNAYFNQERKRAAKDYKKTVRRCKGLFNQELAKNLRNLKSNDTKAYWELIKEKKSSDGKIPKCADFYELYSNMNDGRERVPKSTNLASQGTYHDTDVGKLDGHNTNITEILPGNEILDNPITEDEVTSALNSLRNNKAHGFDMIKNEFLKFAGPKMKNTFVKLFNVILNTGVFPSDWSVGVIKPIYKNKGNRENVNNYRGISLLSCFGKLFTCVINKRIKSFVEFFDTIGPEQAGFRHNYSTMDHLFTLYGLIDVLLAKKKKALRCVFGF